VGAEEEVTVDAARADALMGVALEEARDALAHRDVPIGAVVARLADGEIVARRHNERERRQDPTAHAEVLALRDAARVTRSWRLDGHLLVVTLEPCLMCAAAALHARVDTIVFGATDPKAGAVGSLYNPAADPRLNHEPAVVRGVQGDECGALLREFFTGRRSATDR
jgi:tRNA(adenine34) deaminase